jgi:hypothetical protein
MLPAFVMNNLVYLGKQSAQHRLRSRQQARTQALQNRGLRQMLGRMALTGLAKHRSIMRAVHGQIRLWKS